MRCDCDLFIQAGVSRVRFTNLAFTHNTWLQPSGPDGFVDLQSGFFFDTPDGKDSILRGNDTNETMLL